jgi:lysophospholipase
MAAGPAPEVEIALARPTAKLHVEHYLARAETRQNAIFVHGYSAHCGLYRHVGAALAAAGIAVTLFDCRGHGRSQGRRGHVADFAEYVDDLVAVAEWACARNPGLPWTLITHSFGGTIALDFLLDERRAGKPSRLVLAAPWLKLRMDVAAPKRLAAKVAAKVAPTLSMPNGLRAEEISRSPSARLNFATDPLIHHLATAGWFMATLRAQARIRLRAGKLTVPTLLLLAGEDRIVANESNRALAAAAGGPVETRVYDELFHELFLEPEADAVLADVAAWLLKP